MALSNISFRIHATLDVKAPWCGPWEELIPKAAGQSGDRPPRSMVVLLLSVPPAPHQQDEKLIITVGKKVVAIHPLKWLMDFYALNAKMGPKDVIQQACEIGFHLGQRALVELDSVRPDIEHIEAYSAAMKNLAEAAAKFQVIAGVRLARAILLPAGASIDLATTGGSSVVCYLGGLLESDAASPHISSSVLEP